MDLFLHPTSEAPLHISFPHHSLSLSVSLLSCQKATGHQLQLHHCCWLQFISPLQHLLFALPFPPFVKIVVFWLGNQLEFLGCTLCSKLLSTVHVIDGCPAATSLSPEMYLADVQVEKFSRSLLVHHPITVNHNYVSDSHHIYSFVQGSVIKEMVKETGIRI